MDCLQLIKNSHIFWLNLLNSTSSLNSGDFFVVNPIVSSMPQQIFISLFYHGDYYHKNLKKIKIYRLTRALRTYYEDCLHDAIKMTENHLVRWPKMVDCKRYVFLHWIWPKMTTVNVTTSIRRVSVRPKTISIMKTRSIYIYNAQKSFSVILVLIVMFTVIIYGQILGKKTSHLQSSHSVIFIQSS